MCIDEYFSNLPENRSQFFSNLLKQACSLSLFFCFPSSSCNNACCALYAPCFNALHAIWIWFFCSFKLPWVVVGLKSPDTLFLLSTLPPLPCKLPLVGRTLISCCLIRQASHFICSCPSKCLSVELAFFHYYLVNLLHVIFHFFIGDRSSQE